MGIWLTKQIVTRKLLFLLGRLGSFKFLFCWWSPEQINQGARQIDIQINTKQKTDAKQEGRVLVIGATGYVGNRLVPRLVEAGYPVRAAARSLEKLQHRAWANNAGVELAQVNVCDTEVLERVMKGCSAAYYLVHSMNPENPDFAKVDRKAAQSTVRAAEAAGLKRLIYLGGLGEADENLSHHLQSRAEIATILSSGSVPVTIFRAAMIIGSGSASFEILRYLVDRLPVMVTPRWVNVPSQPIAIRNVLAYLIGCLENQATIGKVFDIGGPEIVEYKELMEIYGQEAGLSKRFIVPVPVFTPRLSSYWIHMVTPVPSYIARPLAEGLRNPCVCSDDSVTKIMPQRLLSCREAISLALSKIQHDQVESHWTDAGKIPPAEWATKGDPVWAGGTIYEDKRSMLIKGSAEDLWQPIVSIGGITGYYYGDWLWRLRGLIDRVFGGVGLRRGRRLQHDLAPGDCLDFWRVKAVEPNERLLLVAEMKLPGQALLEFRINQIDESTTEVLQIAKFLPTGLAGILYWWGVSPLHDLIFNGMLQGIGVASHKPIIRPPEKRATR